MVMVLQVHGKEGGACEIGGDDRSRSSGSKVKGLLVENESVIHNRSFDPSQGRSQILDSVGPALNDSDSDRDIRGVEEGIVSAPQSDGLTHGESSSGVLKPSTSGGREDFLRPQDAMDEQDGLRQRRVRKNNSEQGGYEDEDEEEGEESLKRNSTSDDGEKKTPKKSTTSQISEAERLRLQSLPARGKRCGLSIRVLLVLSFVIQEALAIGLLWSIWQTQATSDIQSIGTLYADDKGKGVMTDIDYFVNVSVASLNVIDLFYNSKQGFVSGGQNPTADDLKGFNTMFSLNLQINGSTFSWIEATFPPWDKYAGAQIIGDTESYPRNVSYVYKDGPNSCWQAYTEVVASDLKYNPYNCSLIPNTTLWYNISVSTEKAIIITNETASHFRFALADRLFNDNNPTTAFSGLVQSEDFSELLIQSKPFLDSELALASYSSCLNNSQYLVATTTPVSGDMSSFIASTCQGLIRNPNGFLDYIDNNGDPWYLTNSYRSAVVETDSWTVLMTIPRHNFFSSIDENTIGSIIVSCVLFIVSVLVSIFLTMYITRPLQHLSRYLKKLASGETIEKPNDSRSTRFQEFEGIFHAEEQVHGLIAKMNSELLVAQEERLERARQINQLQMQLAATVGDTIPKKPISIFIGTWNVGNATPDENLSGWLSGRHDMYVIGVQECVYGANSQDHFYSLIKRSLGHNYLKLAGANIVSGNLRGADVSKVKKNQPKEDVALEQGVDIRDVTGSGGLRLVIFIREEHLPFVKNIKVSREATGIAHVLWNKGGVGITFEIYRTQVCFITSHLAAHQQKVKERNSDFHEIMEGLKLGQKHSILHSSPYVFWCGDLNYRIDMSKEDILGDMEKGDYERMRLKDQLNVERGNERVFCDFNEPKIDFPPTYKFERGINEYESKQGRIPSWCDRVLFSHWPELEVNVKEYNYVPSVTSSDHRPVYAVFDINCPLPYIPLGIPSPCCIIIRNLKFHQKEVVEGESGTIAGEGGLRTNSILPSFSTDMNALGSSPSSTSGFLNVDISTYPGSGSEAEQADESVVVSKEKRKKKRSKKEVKEQESVNICTKPHVKLDKRPFMEPVPYRKYTDISDNGLIFSYDNIVQQLMPSEKRYIREQHIVLTFATDPDSWKSDRHRQVGQCVLSLRAAVDADDPVSFSAFVSRGGYKRNLITGELIVRFGDENLQDKGRVSSATEENVPLLRAK
eukprot:Nk52_evm24s2085 gene=Nk52_evmTU24s2085